MEEEHDRICLPPFRPSIRKSGIETFPFTCHTKAKKDTVKLPKNFRPSTDIYEEIIKVPGSHPSIECKGPIPNVSRVRGRSVTLERDGVIVKGSVQGIPGALKKRGYCLELLAGSLAIKAFAKGKSCVHVKLLMDNVVYINKMGCTHSGAIQFSFRPVGVVHRHEGISPTLTWTSKCNFRQGVLPSTRLKRLETRPL